MTFDDYKAALMRLEKAEEWNDFKNKYGGNTYKWDKDMIEHFNKLVKDLWKRNFPNYDPDTHYDIPKKKH